MGASRRSNPFSLTRAAISAPNPPRFTASWTMTRRLVLATELRMASSSSGTSVRGSTTSTEMPSCSRSPATWSARWTIIWVATTVTSVPTRLMSALPMGMT